ncbi:MAG: hypothetical protein EB127_25995, partial [Alphaproteobacteria bacterium]|nr:hypothetical protein [Alphaproteobacteria bacterium]
MMSNIIEMEVFFVDNNGVIYDFEYTQLEVGAHRVFYQDQWIECDVVEDSEAERRRKEEERRREEE